MDIITKVWTGQAGLGRTYWLFGAIFGIPFWLLINSVQPGSGKAVIAGAALGAFLVWVNTGIWRAAETYTGRPVLASLARMSAVLGYLLAAGVLFGVVYAVATGSWQDQPIDWEKGVYAPPPSGNH
jgi:hypothetical protein